MSYGIISSLNKDANVASRLFDDDRQDLDLGGCFNESKN